MVNPAGKPTTLRQVLHSRRRQVRARIKTLLSTRPHPASARLSGAGLLPAAALMRAERHAAVCLGGGVGGLSFHEPSVFFFNKKGITNDCESFAAVRNSPKTGGVL